MDSRCQKINFVLLSFCILLGVQHGFSQLPDLSNYEFYSAHIEVGANYIVANYKVTDGVVETWLSEERDLLSAIDKYYPTYPEAGQFFRILGNRMIGRCDVPHESGGMQDQQVEVIMDNDWSKVQYFRVNNKYLDLNYFFVFVWDYEGNAYGSGIPYYDHNYYEVDNVEYIAVRYKLDKLSAFPSIHYADYGKKVFYEGELIDSETSLQRIQTHADLVELTILLKRVEQSTEEFIISRPSDIFTRLTGTIGTNDGDIKVLAVSGYNELIREGFDEPIKLLPGSKLLPSDRIKTGFGSHVKIQFSNSAQVNVKELTEVKIDKLSSDSEPVKIRLWLKSGGLNCQVHESTIGPDFEIRMPTLVASVFGTVFNVEYDSLNVSSTVSVTDGVVQIKNEGFDSTDIAGVHFELDSVEVPAWKKVTIVDHEIGELEDFSLNRLEIEPEVVSIVPHDLVSFSPYVIGEDGAKVQVMADWECAAGGEIYENGIFVSNGEYGVYPISCREPTSGLEATALVRVDFPYPDTTNSLLVSSDPVVLPEDTLWLTLFLGSDFNDLKGVDLLHFDLDIDNPELLELFTPEENSFQLSDWSSEVMNLDYDYLEDQQTFTFDMTQLNENSFLSGNGELMKIGFVTNLASPPLQDIRFSISDVVLRDTSDYQFVMETNSSTTIIADRVGPPEIIADKYLFRDTVEVSVLQPDGAEVYYTTNGLTPTEEDEKYTQLIVFDNSELLKVRAFKEGFMPSFSAEASFVIDNSPLPAMILSQPESQSLCEGEQVGLFVEATGTNLTYQWQKHGENLDGAVEPGLIIDPVGLEDAGSYTCIITGELNEVISEPAILEVLQNVEITQHPEAANIKIGEEAIFRIESLGSVLSFKWSKDGIQLDDSDRINGTQSNQLSIKDVSFSDEGMYSCQIIGECNEVESVPVPLSINTKVYSLAQLGIQIKPNPAENVIYIDSGTLEIKSVEVFDLSGKKVLKKELKNSSVKLSSLPSGKFLIRLNMGDKLCVGEFIKS